MISTIECEVSSKKELVNWLKRPFEEFNRPTYTKGGDDAISVSKVEYWSKQGLVTPLYKNTSNSSNDEDSLLALFLPNRDNDLKYFVVFPLDNDDCHSIKYYDCAVLFSIENNNVCIFHVKDPHGRVSDLNSFLKQVENVSKRGKV